MRPSEIEIGQAFVTKEGDKYIIESEFKNDRQGKYFVVWFPGSDNYQISHSNLIGSDRLHDRSKLKVYGVGFARGTKTEPVEVVSDYRDNSYQKWFNMLERCYKNGTGIGSYKNVAVCEEWHNYMNFRKWYFENCNTDFQDKFSLDKDLFSKECKVYSPETCCFFA